jgi:hypothetical protein
MKLSVKFAGSVILLAQLFYAVPEASSEEKHLVQTIPSLNTSFTLERQDYTFPCNTDSKTTIKIMISPGFGTAVSLSNKRILKKMYIDQRFVPGESFKLLINGRPYRFRCLPTDFPDIVVTGAGPFSTNSITISPSIASVTPNGKSLNYFSVLDKWGTPVFWYKTQSNAPIFFDVLFNKYLAWTESPGKNWPYSLDGKLTLTDFNLRPVLSVANIDQHEIRTTSRGTVLLIRYIPRDCIAGVGTECEDLTELGGSKKSTILDGVVDEYDLSGKKIWSWTTKNNLKPSETPKKYFGPSTPASDAYYDLFHINSVDADDKNVFISARNTDSLYAINRVSGRVDWKLGGSKTLDSIETSSDFNFSAQHDFRILPDGTFTVFDNRTGTEGPVRGLKFRVDGPKMSVIETISDSRFGNAPCCGSFREIRSGRYLASWGNRSVITEINSDGKPLKTLTFLGGISSYRAIPSTLNSKALEALKSSMDIRHKS